MSEPESNLDRLLQERAKLDEELRRHKVPVTVLFTDIVGSTAYFDRYGDTAGVAMLQRHAELAGQTIAEFQGTVIKTIGDSVMAEFPEPLLTVRAAVEMQRRLFRLNQSLPERDRIQLRIGINHGLAFRRTGDLYGDAVNLAARITKRTGPGQILISRHVQEALPVDSGLRSNWLDRVTIEGKAEKEDLYEVVWTDTEVYTALRESLTEKLARGELVSPGLRIEELIQSGESVATPERAAELAGPPLPLEKRYEVLGEAGRGGMGVVYRARDRETGELVAVKVLKPEIAADVKVIERFKNELRLARKVTHRNVCRIHDFNRMEGIAYISMELVEGESLRQRLNRTGALPVAEAVGIAIQVCAGLWEAHAQGIIHRDLKPENVMLDRAGNVKLMDFGVARSLESTTALTGEILGTPAYMAPEQAEGKAVDGRTDVYALALILYEMVTGSPAFSASTPIAVALKQIHEIPTPPRQLAPGVPILLERIVLKCLAKNPEHRFPSAEQLAAALEESMETALPLPVPAPAVEATEQAVAPTSAPIHPAEAWTPAAGTGYSRARFWASLRQHWPLVVIVTIVFAAIFAGILVRKFAPRMPRARLGEAVGATRVLKGHGDPVNSIVFSRDGRWLLSGSADKTVRLWDTASGGELHKFFGHTREVGDVDLSPNGQQAASAAFDGTIRLWDIASGEPIRTLQADKHAVSWVVFSPDGRWLASAGYDGKVKLWEVSNGSLRRTLSGHSATVNSVDFSPDGRWLASASNDETVRLWEVSTGREARTLHGHSEWVNAVAFSPDGHWLASGGEDKNIKLWEVTTGRELRTLAGHTKAISDVAFSSDGHWLASASADGTAKVWELATGDEVRSFTSSSGPVRSVAFAPDGRSLAFGAGANIEIWTLR